jgi:hypothetical protein
LHLSLGPDAKASVDLATRRRTGTWRFTNVDGLGATCVKENLEKPNKLS